MNKDLSYEGLVIRTNTEYTPEYLDEILTNYKSACGIKEDKFVHGRGYVWRDEVRQMVQTISTKKSS